jgi:hypothetical protein
VRSGYRPNWLMPVPLINTSRMVAPIQLAGGP